jgi:predicted transcriptional regulator
MASISVTLKDKNAEGLKALADSMDRSRSWLVNKAVEQYLDHHGWMDRKTGEAVATIEAGAAMLPQDEVMARLDNKANCGE